MGIPFQQVSVNVASADFYAGHLEEQVAQTFRDHGVPLKHVILEVTESVYMSQRDHVVARAIKAMRAMGIRIALDDFGTGFASLTHLLTVPVDFVKIDKSFIDKLVPGNASSAIVEGLISISRKLGICVVAEGIETECQLSYLQDSDAAFGQGYLFSKPLPREAATAMLLSETRKSGYKAA
jgi:EAL domain-containing protein (putative c-di-GMP-specific phosphodiesterase class I)